MKWEALVVLMFDIQYRNLWIYSPGHSGVKGNDRADRLAGKPIIASGLRLGRSEVLRSMRHYLRGKSQGHLTIDRLKQRRVERGCARRSSLKGRERAIVSQSEVHWNCVKGNVGETSERRREAHMGISKRIDATLN